MSEPYQTKARASLVNRLRGRYPIGPTLPNGEPEFGWRQFDVSALPPIHGEAADEIERLREALQAIRDYEDQPGGPPPDDAMCELAREALSDA